MVEADHQASFALAVERMCFHKVGSVVVVNQWEPVGLFTERDLMHRVVNKNQDPTATPLRSVMTNPFAVGSPGMSVIEAAELMSDNCIRHLPVYDEGILIGMDYQAGELGVPAADKSRNGTYRALVDMREFGTRFEDIKSGYLLIARALDDGTIKWDCVADQVSVDALDKRYLPETCKDEEEEEERGDG